MSCNSIVDEVVEVNEGVYNVAKQEPEGKQWRNRNMNSDRSCIKPDLLTSELSQQGQWANLPPELVLDIIRRVEESETSWPARSVVVFCASVCKTWRDITKEIVKTPEECGKFTFPISLKQPGPRESSIQCYVKRDGTSSVYYLYHSPTPSEGGRDKLLMSAKRIRRTTRTDFIISLSPDDFSRASNAYIGKLRSNFLGTKFTIYDSQPPIDATNNQVNLSRLNRRFHAKQVSPRVPACNYNVGSISYQLNVLRSRGPRRMHCVMNSIPVSSIQEDGKAPTPLSFPLPVINNHSISNSSGLLQQNGEPLVLRNKFPRWHEQLQCWCLNFKGRVTVASVKNFQLVAGTNPSSYNVPVEEQEQEQEQEVILQFGKIGKDIFTMDYRYPLTAFQAFAICLSSFDTKPVCE